MALPKTPTSFPNGVPKPLFVRKPKPENMTNKEKEAYWKEEHRKWVEGIDFQGYGIGLTGSLYFYGQEGFLKHRLAKMGRATIERPTIRDVDFYMHHMAARAVKARKSLLILKATGVGLSSFGAGYSHYTACAYSGSTSLITSSSTQSMSNLFMDKIVEPLAHFDNDIIKKHDKDSKKEGQLKYENLNKSKQKCFLKINTKNFLHASEAMSAIDCRETSEDSKSPFNFAGIGGNFAFVDEFAIHKKKKDVASALTSRLRDENTREMTGFLLLGGALEISGSDALDSQDVKDLRDMLKPSYLDANSMMVEFLPYYMGFNAIQNNGHSDILAAEHWHNIECEKRDKDPDRSALRLFLMTNPRTLEDVLENVRTSRFEDAVTEKIVLWTQEIKKKEVPLQECNISLVDNRYHFVKGKTTNILEHPKAGVEYIITCDGTCVSETTSSTPVEQRSKMAAVVTKIHDPTTRPYMPVCTFAEAPKSVEESFYRIIDLLRFYNQWGGVKKINIEQNVGGGEFLGAILDREGLGHLCAKKRDFSRDGLPEKSTRFYYRDVITKNRQYNLANSFLKRHIESVLMINLLEEMLMPMNENCDLLDAWLGVFETIPEIGFDKPMKKKVMPPREQYIMKNVGGKIFFEVQKIGVRDEVREIINRFSKQPIKN